MSETNTAPSESKSMSDACWRALVQHQQAVDQARAVAKLLRDQFAAMVQGHDGPDDDDVMSALQIIVDRLGTCGSMTDCVALERDGREIIARRDLATSMEVARGNPQ